MLLHPAGRRHAAPSQSRSYLEKGHTGPKDSPNNWTNMTYFTKSTLERHLLPNHTRDDVLHEEHPGTALVTEPHTRYRTAIVTERRNQNTKSQRLRRHKSDNSARNCAACPQVHPRPKLYLKMIYWVEYRFNRETIKGPGRYVTIADHNEDQGERVHGQEQLQDEVNHWRGTGPCGPLGCV